MTNKPKFKGGPIFLNSGGMGPDDYLIKPVSGGRWTRVIFRWGRHWTGSKEDYESDKAAMGKLLPLERVAVSDNYRRYIRMKTAGSLITMNATEFLTRYGW